MLKRERAAGRRESKGWHGAPIGGRHPIVDLPMMTVDNEGNNNAYRAT